MDRRKAFLLRIDPALWRELEAWAQDEFRSVNGQIEYLLRQAAVQRRGARVAPPPKVAPAAPEPPPTPPPSYPSGQGLMDLDIQD